jgi:tyrosine-protein phosphatase YwqE
MFGFFNNKKSLLESGLINGATDNHSHVLYGVDDGVRTEAESLEILKYFEGLGLKTLWLTPHIMEEVENTTSHLQSRFDALRAAYNGTIELHLASEYMLDNVFLRRLDKNDILKHGEDSVLVETSTWAPPMDLWDLLGKIMSKGYRPILAHPERYRYMDNDDYERLAGMGVILQLNIPSIVGVYGPEVQMKAIFILENGWYSMTGSDCHRFKAVQGQFSSKVLDKGTLTRLDSLLHPDF